MAISGTVHTAPADARGFDINQPVSASLVQQFRQAGYQFCVRYVGRTQMADYDLTGAEAQAIVSGGLALMVVQHVLNPGWTPSGALGTQYGTNAGAFSSQIGIPAGVNVWCDLECVAAGVPAQEVAAFCNNWYDEVAAVGYVPGLYVGYDPGLSDAQLYGLKFQHYWAAYNTNSSVPTRGYQMVQSPQKTHVAGLSYDDDVIKTDALGGRPLWLAPA